MRTARPHVPAQRATAGDGGFTLIEVLVAMVVITLVMTAVTPVLVQSVSAMTRQGGGQVAAQVANDALERAHALRPSSLLVGRDEQATVDQWAVGTASTAIKPFLTGMLRASDPAAVPGSGQKAALPTSPYSVSIAGVTYQQNWYVGRCWQPKADPTQLTLTVGNCVSAIADPTDVPFFRIVVVVTWAQKSCTGPCTYVASTLVSIGVDPVFDLNQPPVTITDPVGQNGYVAVGTSLQILATGGQLPRTWTATGLPPGLTISSGGGLIGGTPTTSGVYQVSLTVTDTGGDGRPETDLSTFAWTIVLPLTSPGVQVGEVGVATSLTVPRPAGLPAVTWSATGLPAGLTIGASTGVITGTPTTVRAATPVTVTVNPASTASVSFTWQVVAAVQLPAFPVPAMSIGTDAGSFTLPFTGGLGPFTWQGSGLPDGVSIDAATGKITGIVRSGTRYVTSVTVTDSLGGTAVLTVVCNVTGVPASLAITTPDPTAPNRSTPVDVAVPPALTTAAAAGGTTPYAWTATNLPTGVTLTSGGVFGGVPTAAGTYLVTLTVTGPVAKKAVLMFTWTVTP